MFDLWKLQAVRSSIHPCVTRDATFFFPSCVLGPWNYVLSVKTKTHETSTNKFSFRLRDQFFMRSTNCRYAGFVRGRDIEHHATLC